MLKNPYFMYASSYVLFDLFYLFSCFIFARVSSCTVKLVTPVYDIAVHFG